MRELRVAVGGVEAVPRRIEQAEAVARRPPARACRLRCRRRGSGARLSIRSMTSSRRRLPARSVHAPSRAGRWSAPHDASTQQMDRPVGRAAGGPAAGHRPRPLRRRHQLPAPASHAGRALQPCARQHPFDRHRSGAGAAGRGGGVDRRRYRRRAADRFPRRADREARALSPAGAGARAGCATSASRWRRCLREDPYIAEDAADLVTMEVEELPPLLDCRATSPANSPSAATPRPTILTQGYGDVEAVFKSARAYRRAQAHQRPAFRRAAGDAAARSAATTPRATCWSCTAPPRCRTGTRS